MPVNHKLLNHNFNNGFQTHNAILATPYAPEVLILGTYNPDTLGNGGVAEMFYGRNYFWPAFLNLQSNNPTLRLQRRDVAPHAPNMETIFLLCDHFKLSFADLITAVLNNNAPHYMVDGNIINYQQQQFNLINDDHLLQLNALGQVSWNANNIIAYLETHPTINTVYFTRQPAGVYRTQWNLLSTQNYGRNIVFKWIYTPSGQALPGKPRIEHILRHWLHNHDPNYHRLDHDWLINKGVNPDLFI